MLPTINLDLDAVHDQHDLFVEVDDGGTDNGGLDTSEPFSFTIMTFEGFRFR